MGNAKFPKDFVVGNAFTPIQGCARFIESATGKHGIDPRGDARGEKIARRREDEARKRNTFEDRLAL